MMSEIFSQSFFETIGVIGSLMLLIEWRYRKLHDCFDKHIEHASGMDERLFKLEERMKINEDR